MGEEEVLGVAEGCTWWPLAASACSSMLMDRVPPPCPSTLRLLMRSRSFWTAEGGGERGYKKVSMEEQANMFDVFLCSMNMFVFFL